MMDRNPNTNSFSNSLLVFIFGFVFGVLISSFYSLSPLTGLFFLIMGLAIILAERVWRKQVGKEVFLIALLIISFSLGTLRFAVKDFHEKNPELLSEVGREVELEGLVISEPEFRDNTTRFLVYAKGEKVLVSDWLYSEVLYGDVIRVRGRLSLPEIIDDGSGRPFDYGAYLAKDDIYFLLSFAKAEILSRDQGHPIKHILFGLKRKFVSQVKTILTEPYAGLLAGLVVSGKEAMPKETLENFRRSGLIHIVVLSGYNVTIIAEFIRRVLEKFFISLQRVVGPGKIFFGPKFALGGSIVSILLFIIMTGAEATVVRASIMVMVVIVAKMLGRNYSAPRALLLAGFAMVLINPKILIFDPSFQLSFLATSALIYVVPIVERVLKFIPEKWEFRTTIATTTATQVTVLPLLVYSMGDFSLVSLPANILVLLFIPVTMLMGFVATMISFFSPILALPFTYIAHILLSWILGVSSVLGNLSFASIGVPAYPFWITGIIYFSIVLFVRYRRLEN